MARVKLAKQSPFDDCNLGSLTIRALRKQARRLYLPRCWKRPVLIRGVTEQGTAFWIERKGKLYLITAKHVAAGLPDQDATIKIRL